MNKPIRILGIAGSLRRKSYNRAALRAAQQLAPEDAVIDIFELDGIPVFSEDDERQPPVKIVELKKRIREADAILFVTPEYNYSIPGGLKNAIDWASRPYGDNAWTASRRRSWARPGNARHSAGTISSAPGVRVFEHSCDQSAGGDDRQRSAKFRRGGKPDE